MTKMTAWVLLLTACLASCGGGSGDQSSKSTNVGDDGPSAELFEIGGVQYSSQAGVTDVNTVKNSAASGTTPASGEFHFGYSVDQQCSTESNTNGSSKQVCINDAAVTSPVVLSICGKVIATINESQTFPLTIWDLFPDQQSIDNFTSVALMANINSGDPLSTGVTIGLPTSGCQTSWSWATADIQNDAASFRDAIKPTNGTTPAWPSLQAVRDYETASYRCARSGLYTSIHDHYATAANVSGSLQGSMFVLVDLAGHISGAFDFDMRQPQPLYPGVMTFSADNTVSPGGTAPFAYSATSSDSIPNLQISGQLDSNGMHVHYHTTDNSLVSTGDGLMWPYSYIYTPVKYRFLARDLQYPARPGYPGPTETLVLTLDIGTDNSAEANLFDFPALLPYSTDTQPGGLLVRGTLNGDTLTLHYVDDLFGPAAKAGNFSLKFDSVAKTLTGRFPTYDGKSFVTFGTDSPPLQGCGASFPQQQT